MKTSQFVGTYLASYRTGIVLSTILGIVLLIRGYNKWEAIVSSLSLLSVFLAMWIEKSYVRWTLVAPLTAFSIAAFIRWGIGATLMHGKEALPDSTVIEKTMIDHSLELQTLWLVLVYTVLIVFLIIRIKGRYDSSLESQVVNSGIVWLTVLCGLFAVGWLSIGWLSGTLDRTPEVYLKWVTRVWRPDSLFVAFARFRDVFFLLVPLAYCKSEKMLTKLVLVGLVIAHFLLAIVLGGRGIVLNPALWLVLGLYMVQSIRLSYYISTILIFSLVASVGVYALKSGVVQGIDRMDYGQRLVYVSKRFGGSFFKQSEYEKQAFATRMYGCADGLTLTSANGMGRGAGFVRWERLAGIGRPKIFFKDVKPLRDSHMIVEELLGTERKIAEDKEYVSFECVSFVGDLYWRGRWLGVAIGSLLFALWFRFICGLWYRFATLESVTGILIMAFPATFLVLFPAGSVGETVWLWTWDLPKYVMLVMVLSVATKLVRKGWRVLR